MAATAPTESRNFVRVAALDDLRRKGVVVVSSGRHGIALFYHEDTVYAVDNR